MKTDHDENAFPHDQNGYVHCAACPIDPEHLFVNKSIYGLPAIAGLDDEIFPITCGPWLGTKYEPKKRKRK
jgi:hypothetical protein